MYDSLDVDECQDSPMLLLCGSMKMCIDESQVIFFFSEL